MKKALKYIMMTAITLVIALGCLFLPSELSKWEDKQMIGSISLEKIDETKVEHVQQMTMLEKLQLFYNEMKNTTDTISINQGKYLKEDDIRKLCKNEVGLFQEMGFFKNMNINFEEDSMITSLNFYISAEEPTKSMIVWHVKFTGQGRELNINLDDETGKILSFSQQGIDLKNDTFTGDAKEFVNNLFQYYGIAVESPEQIDQEAIQKIGDTQLNFVMEENNEKFNCYIYMGMSQYFFGFDNALDKKMGFSK